MKNFIKARIAPLFGFTACAAVIVCCIALLSLTGCIVDKLIESVSSDSSESNPVELTIGDWKDGTLKNYWSKEWYSFSVTPGKMYAVYQNDFFSTGSSPKKTADIMVSAKYQHNDYIDGFGNEYWGKEPPVGSNYEDNPRLFTADSTSGTVLLLVQASTVSGTFAIKVVEITIGSSTPQRTLDTVSANGDTTTTTTQLTLTFNDTINGLNANDITLTGVPGINKGTLTNTGSTYYLPINGFTADGTVTVSVFKIGYNITGTKTAAIKYYGGGGSAVGLYTGIIGFNDDLYTKEPGLLNETSKASFNTFIDGLTKQPASALYYAVDNAVTMLTSVPSANLPSDLVNVSIVTFTDGFDNVSRQLNKTYATVEAYRTAVKNKLDTTTIGGANGLKISAYSIGLKGGDDVSEAAFMLDLNALKSNQGTAKLATNMGTVSETFEAIAKSLYSKSQFYSIKLRLTTGIDNGERIRFTFDNIANAAGVTASQIYIEGIFTEASNGSISLTNVVYHGMDPNNATENTVNGAISGVYVDFTFNVTSNLESMTDNIKLWKYSGNAWSGSSEFGGSSSVETNEEKKSAIIILVLDCSSSLDANGANGFSAMKTAAKGFISTLVSGQEN